MEKIMQLLQFLNSIIYINIYFTIIFNRFDIRINDYKSFIYFLCTKLSLSKVIISLYYLRNYIYKSNVYYNITVFIYFNA